MGNLIKVPFPHMALNAHNVPPPDYLMFNTWKVNENDTVNHIVGWVRKVAVGMPGGRIETLIFNSHGSPGSIHIGQWIKVPDLGTFQAWNTEKGPLIKNIWIVACQVAGQRDFVSGGVDGKSFLKDLAAATGATVKGGVRKQKTGMKEIPIGYIDEWEGEVIVVAPGAEPVTELHGNSSHE
jgi:hypothetical protein